MGLAPAANITSWGESPMVEMGLLGCRQWFNHGLWMVYFMENP